MQSNGLPLDKLIAFRKDLHRHPEVSEHERKTARRVWRFLKDYRPDSVIKELGGHGIAATYDSGKPGKHVLIRCELDALPIVETNDFDHKSQVPGASHKCGHDGHMAILAGLATSLKQKRPASGKVTCLFQPAEENGAGAVGVINDSKFENIEPDFVFALHNLPGFEKGLVVWRSGSFTAAVNSIVIQLDGKTSHAGEPEKGINPAQAIAEILTETNKMNRPEDDPDFALITPIMIRMGEDALGISAGHALVKLTMRTWDTESLEKLMDRVQQQVEEIANRHRLHCMIGWSQFFAANQVHPDMAAIVESAAISNKFEHMEKPLPFRWGEDFGLFTEKFPGAMFGIGAGTDCPALHNPDYDFPDDLIPIGIRMFRSIIDQILG